MASHILEVFYDCPEDCITTAKTLEAISQVLGVKHDAETDNLTSSFLDCPWIVCISDGLYSGENLQLHYKLKVGSDPSLSKLDDPGIHFNLSTPYLAFMSRLEEGRAAVTESRGSYRIEIWCGSRKTDYPLSDIAKCISDKYFAALKEAFPHQCTILGAATKQR